MRRLLSAVDDLLLVVVLAGAGWLGYQAVRPDTPSDQPRRPLVETQSHPAIAVLAELEVKGRAPRTGYDRKLFGVGSVDLDRNGCDIRNDILRRDLGAVETKPGTNGCKVVAGNLIDPYTGDRLFRLAQVEIDHVVALSDAWQKGAQQLTRDERVRFGNDPRNLQAVSATANRQKGDGDAATWLPSNKEFRCQYVATQIEVKAAYRLWVTAAERDTMLSILRTCQAPTPRSRTRSATTTSGS